MKVPKFSGDQVTGSTSVPSTTAPRCGTAEGRHPDDLLHEFGVRHQRLRPPGKTAEIELTVEGRKALVGPDLRYTVPEGASWSDDVAQGIFRSADLEVFPAVYISDTFVRTSVTDRTLSYDV